MPSEVPLRDVRSELERHGWTLDRISGSHFIFVKVGEIRHVSVPVHKGRVKPSYIRKIERIHGITIRG